MHPKMIRFARFEVNFEQRELRKSGTRVPLQHKPFRILEMLLRRPGALVSRQELAKELWPGLHVNFEHGLNSAVNSLRQALEDSPRESRFIETRSGLGYRFIAPIAIADGSASSPAKTTASDSCLRGRFFLNKMTNEGVQRALGCFQSALNEDPDCASAYSGLADCHCQLALNGTARAADLCRAARDCATSAVRLNPDLPEAHLAMGRVSMLFDWDWTEAADHWNRASVLNPSLPEVHRLRALAFSARRRHDDALHEISLALDLDPLSLPIGIERAWLLYLSRRFADAVTQSWNVLTLEPTCAPIQMLLGLAYHQVGSSDEAFTELENACICSERHPAAVASLGHVYAAAGLIDKALDSLAELLAQSQRHYVPAYNFALVYTALNQQTLARDALKKAAQEREPSMLWLDVDPRFQPN